ncbi:hypothetical protein [Actinokineospora sp. UTMC 2448]|uniref:hypothetical protein n=1 Tax=Actinokineospora sp. UTMC 2448 TaxID=2268449 RepID=UPI0021644331|nr:hypothetical protein [Actinokineospora sp. UTMC 2448]UVS81845.1 hypothetical protein Actkin_05609 [Actinokineospora sp. UTMC 2448]
MAGLPIDDVLNAVVSHAESLGAFERVNGFEPGAPPGPGLHAAVWVQDITPVPRASGLAATSVRLELALRTYSRVEVEPPDEVDPTMTRAIGQLMTALTADFDLGGTVRNVDVLGAHGPALGAQAGYSRFPASGELYRVMTLTIPVIINDVFPQSP